MQSTRPSCRFRYVFYDPEITRGPGTRRGCARCHERVLNRNRQRLTSNGSLAKWRLIINNIHDDIYGAGIIAQNHCERSPGSLDECRLSVRWLPTLRPSQTTWAVSPPVGSDHPHPPSPFYYYSAKPDTHFTMPLRVEGLSQPGTAVSMCSLCQRLYIAMAFVTNTTIHGWIQTLVLSHHS